MNIGKEIAFLLANCRGIRIESGFQPDKCSVATAKMGDGIFRNIHKADPKREMNFASMGTFTLEVTSREYDEIVFVAMGLEEAVAKAVQWVWERKKSG